MRGDEKAEEDGDGKEGDEGAIALYALRAFSAI